MNALLMVLLALSAQTKTVEEKTALLLSAHHELPPRAVFEREVPGAKEVLKSLAMRAELFRPHRNRAIEALALWPDDDVRALYRALLADEATPELTKHRILLLVPRVFAGETAEIMEPWRTHPNPRFRRTAAIALRRSERDPGR
jgi:hypothetical protein